MNDIVIKDEDPQVVKVTIGPDAIEDLLDAFLALYKGAATYELTIDASLGVVITDQQQPPG